MKRALGSLAVLAACAACVPASDELPPAGAAGFDTVPSPEAQGAPFETSDGWEITIDRLVLQLSVSATPLSRGYGNSESFVFEAKTPARIFARALPVGPAQVSVSLMGRFDYFGDDESVSKRDRAAFEGDVTVLGVDEATVARFAPPPRTSLGNGSSTGAAGATMVLVVHARHLSTGRILTIDAALGVVELASPSQQYPPPADEERGASVEVRDSDISVAPLPLNAGALFPSFADVAAADADGDGDGRITADELEAADLVQALDHRMPAFFGR